MKILVTGGSGFIGSNLIRFLLAETTHSVVNVDKLTYAGNAESLRDIESDSRYAFERVDICDGERVAEVFERHRPDAVMHLAAESHVDRSIDEPDDFIQTNVVGTSTLLQVARAYWASPACASPDSFRFLHVSTDEVYGSLTVDAAAFTESSRYDPHSPYAASKAASDHLVRAWHDTYGFPTLVTNCSNNFGPFQFPEKFIPTVILSGLRGAPIPVYGAGENIRDWLFVRDHAEALTLVLEKGTIGDTYNIGGCSEVGNLDLARIVCSLLDEMSPLAGEAKHGDLITFVADRPGHDFRYAMDITKIRTELGWRPSHQLDDALRDTVRWYLDHRGWWENVLSGEYRLERLGLGQAGPVEEVDAQ